MNHWLQRLQTVRGQMTLFGVTFVGAIGLAVLALLLRDRLFEVYVRESYPPVSSGDRERVKELASEKLEPTRCDELLSELRGTDLRERTYGAWIDDPELDPANRLGQRFASAQLDWVLDRLQRTLVAGNPAQRARAVEWLKIMADRPEALELIRYARTRAVRRHERDLLRQAQTALEQASASQDSL